LYVLIFYLNISKVNSKRFAAHKFVLQCRLGFDTYTALVKATTTNEANADERITILKLDDAHQANQEYELEKWLMGVYTGTPQFVRNLIGCEHDADSAAVVGDGDGDKEDHGVPGFDDDDLELAKKMSGLSTLDIADPSDDYFEYSEAESFEGDENDGDSVSKENPRRESNLTTRVGGSEARSAYAVYKELKKDDSIVNKKRYCFFCDISFVVC